MSRPNLPPDLVLGRAQTQLALGVIFVLSAAPTVANWVHGDFLNVGLKVAGFAVTAFVLWQVYRGSQIALFLTLALSGLGGFALMLLSPLGGVSVPTVLLLLAGLAFAVSAIALYAHAPIKAFLAAQRRSGSGQSPRRP
jgi:hypothetical protein